MEQMLAKEVKAKVIEKNALVIKYLIYSWQSCIFEVKS